MLHDGRGDEDLLPHSDEISDGGIVLRVLELATLISVKASTGRARNKLIVPILLALQAERSG